MSYKITLFIIALFGSLISSANDTTGIRFEEGKKWGEVLASAKQNNKLVFVDIYTAWCAPCKRMSQEVFPDKKVGEKYNASFINYKIDAEKGEGVSIAKQYNIRSYPTYLFVDGNGTLFYTVTSYMQPAQFIQQATIALTEFKDPKPYPVWEVEYETKKNDPSFLFAYIQKRNKLRKDNTELIEIYFSKLPKPKWLTHDNVLLLSKNKLKNINTPIFLYMASNLEKAELLIKGEVIPGIIHDMMYDAQLKVLDKCIAENDNISFENSFIKANGAMPERLITKPWFVKSDDDYWRLHFYKQTKRFRQFLAIASYYYDKKYMKMTREVVLKTDTVMLAQALGVYKDTTLVRTPVPPGLVDMTIEAFKKYFSNRFAGELKSAGEIVLFNSNSKSMFLKALKWLQKSNEIDETPENMYIQGLLYYRLNKVNESVKWLEKAKGSATNEKLKAKIDIALEAVKIGKPFADFANDITL